MYQKINICLSKNYTSIWNLLFVFRVVKEVVHNTGEKINLRKIKKGVVDIDPAVIELNEFVWIFE